MADRQIKTKYYSQLKIRYLKKKIIPLLCQVPYLKFIGITGSIAYGTASKNSDIDLFMITSSRRLWTCRFFTNFILDQKKLRSLKQKNRICVNFFVAEDNLKQLSPTFYDKFWLITLRPARGSGYKRLISENKWIKKYFPNYDFKKEINPLPLSIKKKFLELVLSGKIGDRFEKFIAKKQKIIIKKNSQRMGREGLKLTKDLAKIHFINLGNKYEKRYKNLLKKIRL